ncbi:MAG: Ig-like domain-containing protein [Promethearchaeota archaeon]
MKRKIILISIMFFLLISLYTANGVIMKPAFKLQLEQSYQVTAIPFNWFDITNTGTHLILGDDDYTTVSLPFDFPFYDASFDTALVSSNGYLTFNTSTFPTSTVGNIPQNYYTYLIALFWRDLYPDDGYGGGGVYYQSFGSYFVIQYDNISTCCIGELAGDFEVILHDTGLIQMFYDNMTTTGTIGVDRGNYEDYTTYSDPTSGTGIEFSPNIGVSITSDPYYYESDTSYTLTWVVQGGVSIDYFEVFMNDVSQGTITYSYMDLPVSPYNSYNLTVVLHATDLSIYRDQIFLIIQEPLTQYFVKQTMFDWIDIRSTGNHLSLSDDSSQTVSLPFPFPFFDDTFSEVSISSNGFLTFDISSNPTQTSGEIPQDQFPYLIALFWRDLYPDDGYGGGGVYYQSFGSYFVIQYDNISTCCSGESAGDFEVILHDIGLIQMFYKNMVYPDGIIGVDKGDMVYYTTYSFKPSVNELGIEFTRGPGISIISPIYYEETETSYTLEWSPMNTKDILHYEVFIGGISLGTTTATSIIITVSSPNSYNVTVVLYTTESSYRDQIHLSALKSIVSGLHTGAYLTYRFEYTSDQYYNEYQYMIYTATIMEEISPNHWLVNIEYSVYNESSIDPIDTYSVEEELDAAFLTGNTLFWSNAHLLNVGDSFMGLGGTAIIVGEKTIDIPEMGVSFLCWQAEISMGVELPQGFAYFDKITGVFISLETPNYLNGRLIDFIYPFVQVNDPPYLSIREPDDGDTFDTNTIEVEVTATDDKPGLRVEVQLDEEDWELMTKISDTRWSYTFTDVSEGDHTIQVRATDSDGIQVTKSVSFTIGAKETSYTREKDEIPSISPGFEFSLLFISLISIFFYYKRRKSS